MSDADAPVDGLFVVVVNWNGGDKDNARCLRSILDQGVAEERIVFVDNASTDGSREAMHAAFPNLERIDHGIAVGVEVRDRRSRCGRCQCDQCEQAAESDERAHPHCPVLLVPAGHPETFQSEDALRCQEQRAPLPAA